ncbi:MAG: SpoIIE family protein phosphatase [Actinomycetia bacterium]|nr:SpoIIE family protein phosphatase [Actinomycetes bacterium]
MTPIRERVSLKRLLASLGAIGVLIVLVAGVLLGYRGWEVTTTTSEVLDVFEPAGENAATLILANSEMERGVSIYAISQEEAGLTPYVDGERRSALALQGLERLLGNDSDIGPKIDRVASDRQAWLTQTASPAIAAVRDGNAMGAQEIVTDQASAALYEELVVSSADLGNDINSVRSQAFRELSDLTTQLLWALGIALLVLLGAVVAAGLIMRSWVLLPLEALQTQIREVASDGSHETPITPSGPKELAAVGLDAETMRRKLVAEIDEARNARVALGHDARTVSAIRNELRMSTDPTIPGLDIRGEVQPAEGVLAGDWWECVLTPSGTAALVLSDVSGHGPEAGVAAMRVKHLLVQSLASGATPDAALDLAARSFTDDIGRFATVAIVVLDPSDGTLAWSNAGHHPPLVIDPAGNWRRLERSGPLLSWIGGTWTVGRGVLEPGEYLMLYSDGLVESHDTAGQELEADGLLAIAEKVAQSRPDAAELVQQVLAQARDRAQDWYRDDVTLVCARRTPESGDVPTN